MDQEVDAKFRIPMHDPFRETDMRLPKLELGRLGKPYDAVRMNCTSIGGSECSIQVCWYTWLTITCSKGYEDLIFHYWQESTKNHCNMQVNDYVQIEYCWSSGTNVELARINANFQKANNWRWYPWSNKIKKKQSGAPNLASRTYFSLCIPSSLSMFL